MEAISRILQSKEVQETVSSSSQNPASSACWRCFGTGIRFRDCQAKEYLRAISASKAESEVITVTCICSRRRSAQAILKQVPPVFNKPKLSRLEPRPDLHAKQPAAIALIRQHPNDSFLFLGKNYVGKSHLAWALFRHAVAQGRPAVACALRDLLYEFRRLEINAGSEETVKSPRLTKEQLTRPGKPWLIYIDEFEKARPTEFSSEMLFNVLDAARNFKHQIVITSNLQWSKLRDHWSRIDEVWGNSIMTRLQDCREINFF